ncbi:hypothetical protein [Accumulibacter sp.]|uniref:hypothetical protein n=1 Tax=Accumulibacter sp. TaxID=2053492 RepID=UPI002C548D92|nr:hypothetical protein [Accumulibacter sp.]HNG16205.1 hypothetical protein [Accumulibacter sp.]
MASFKDYINKVKAVTGIGRFTESMRKGRELAAQRKAREEAGPEVETAAENAGEDPSIEKKTRGIIGSIRARNKALAELDE